MVAPTGGAAVLAETTMAHQVKLLALLGLLLAACTALPPDRTEALGPPFNEDAKQGYVALAGNAWDAHKDLQKNHSGLSAKVDKPMAGLLRDLKQRGLLDETIVVWATEFGRTPGAEGGNGRDHHPYGFSIWMAGAGLKKGIVHGATDELGFHAVENRHYVTDVHATVLNRLRIDPTRLEVPGRKRLEIDYGKPIEQILA